MNVKRVKAFTLLIIGSLLLVAVGCQQKVVDEQPSSAFSQQTPSENKASAGNSAPKSDNVQKELEGVDFFIGEWEIWLPGGIAESKSQNHGDGTVNVSREYVPGAAGNTLIIKQDFSYIWDTPTEKVTGIWEETEDGRIVLLQGQYEFDWYVEKTSANEIKFYSFGMEEYGTRIQK